MPPSRSRPTHLLRRRNGVLLGMRLNNRHTDPGPSMGLTLNNGENGGTRLKDDRTILSALVAQARLLCLLVVLHDSPNWDKILFKAPRPRAPHQTACGIGGRIGHVQSIAGWRSIGCSLWFRFRILPRIILFDSFPPPSPAELKKRSNRGGRKRRYAFTR